MIVTCEMDRKCWPRNVKKGSYEISNALSVIFKFWSPGLYCRADFWRRFGETCRLEH